MLRQTQISLKFYFKDLRYRDAFLLFIIIGPPARWPEGSYELTVCPFVLPSFFPSLRKFSLDWLISFFLKLSMVLVVHVLCVAEPDFLKKIFLPEKWVF